MANQDQNPNQSEKDDQKRQAPGAPQGGPVLGEGEKVGPWNEEDIEDEQGGGREAQSGGGNRPSESEKPSQQDQSRWGQGQGSKQGQGQGQGGKQGSQR